MTFDRDGGGMWPYDLNFRCTHSIDLINIGEKSSKSSVKPNANTHHEDCVYTIPRANPFMYGCMDRAEMYSAIVVYISNEETNSMRFLISDRIF